MIRKILKWFGYQIVYTHKLGEWSTRYNHIDFASGRPIHPNMSVAPPTAKLVIRRIG
jgi:hypothetical protein